METPLTAQQFFAAKLRYETDPSDLAAARAAGVAPLLLDVRSAEAWSQGHIPGAVHLPNADLGHRAAGVIATPDTDVVVYCWGPGCNGSTRAAHTLASLGYARVRELVGGFEYWAREGLAVVTPAGRVRRDPDPLTAPTPSTG